MIICQQAIDTARGSTSAAATRGGQYANIRRREYNGSCTLSALMGRRPASLSSTTADPSPEAVSTSSDGDSANNASEEEGETGKMYEDDGGNKHTITMSGLSLAMMDEEANNSPDEQKRIDSTHQEQEDTTLSILLPVRSLATRAAFHDPPPLLQLDDTIQQDHSSTLLDTLQTSPFSDPLKFDGVFSGSDVSGDVTNSSAVSSLHQKFSRDWKSHLKIFERVDSGAIDSTATAYCGASSIEDQLFDFRSFMVSI